MVKIPSFNAPPEYYELRKFSIDDPEGFWEKMAQKSFAGSLSETAAMK